MSSVIHGCVFVYIIYIINMYQLNGRGGIAVLQRSAYDRRPRRYGEK